MDSDLKSKILQAIKEHDGWGLFELCQYLDMDMKLASQLTKELIEEGKIGYSAGTTA